MKWFKHLSNSHRDKTLKGIFRKYGLEGEARFWRLIELMAEAFENDCTSFCFELENLRESLRFRSLIDCQSFLDTLAILTQMKVNYSENDCQIIWTKMLEIKDNHSSNLQVKTKRLPRNLALELEEELELEKDIIIHQDAPHPEKVKSDASVKKKPKFDLDILYAAYPKKEGKKQGIIKLERIVTSQEKFDQVQVAIKNYSDQCNGKEIKFIKLFSSFVSVWEDYLIIEKSKEEIQDQEEFDKFDLIIRQAQAEANEEI